MDRQRMMNQREHAINKQRDAEAQRASLTSFVSKQGLYSTAANMDDTIDLRRKRLEVEQLAREEAMETMTRTAQLESRRREYERSQEDALAAVLESTKREEESRRREIQRICEDDPGLRELQSKLHMAYISQERASQLREKELIAIARANTEAVASRAMEATRLAALEAERVKAEEVRLKGEERKRTLEAQLEERQLREFLAGEQEAARERAMVDAILAKIASEDAAEVAAAASARAETIRAIDEFKAQRERAIAAALAAEREEVARTAAYLASQAAREDELKRAKATNTAERDAQYRLIAAEQEAARAKREEEDALRWLLVEEEAERRREADDARKRAAEEKTRLEMRAANDQQRALRDKLAAEEREREQRLIAQFLAKCAEEDAKEALARKAKDEAMARYKVEIESQRSLNQHLFEAQKLEEARAAEEVKRRDAFKKQVIDEARRRLLAEHASVLRGFLPRGVIASPQDLAILKAFDGNKDGVLTPDEMDLARAAFAAYDPGAAAGGAARPAPAARGVTGGAGAAAAPVSARAAAGGVGGSALPPAGGARGGDAAARNRAAAMGGSLSLGGGVWDDSTARQRTVAMGSTRGGR